MTPLRPPTTDEALEGQQRLAVETLEGLIANNNLGDYRTLAAELLENHDAVDVVAAALRSLTREPDDTPVTITEERPLPMRRERSSNNRGGGDRGRGNRSFGGGRRDNARSGERRSSSSRREGGRREGGRREGGQGRSRSQDDTKGNFNRNTLNFYCKPYSHGGCKVFRL